MAASRRNSACKWKEISRKGCYDAWLPPAPWSWGSTWARWIKSSRLTRRRRSLLDCRGSGAPGTKWEKCPPRSSLPGPPGEPGGERGGGRAHTVPLHRGHCADPQPAGHPRPADRGRGVPTDGLGGRVVRDRTPSRSCSTPSTRGTYESVLDMLSGKYPSSGFFRAAPAHRVGSSEGNAGGEAGCPPTGDTEWRHDSRSRTLPGGDRFGGYRFQSGRRRCILQRPARAGCEVRSTSSHR